MIQISVIVLVYNMEELLPRCLSSLEKQTMKGIQFILVDDGSKDSSGRICDEWKPKGQLVKVIHKNNEGVTAGWMDGVNAADGEYVGFVDSDDYIDAEMYERLWSAVEENRVDISMCNHLYEHGKEKVPCKSMIPDGVYRNEDMDSLRALMLPKLAMPYLSPSLCNKIFRKKLFQSNFQFCDKSVTIADDVSVVLPCIFGASSFAYTDKPYYHYVTREDSVTHSYKANMYAQHEKLLANLERALMHYCTVLPEDSFAMTTCAMGNQWLRMITNAKLSKSDRKALLKVFYQDKRYVEAAEIIDKQEKNRWTVAYCDVVLRHRFIKYLAMTLLLRLKNDIFHG